MLARSLPAVLQSTVGFEPARWLPDSLITGAEEAQVALARNGGPAHSEVASDERLKSPPGCVLLSRMKSDLYTKIVLTVIAACLLGLVFRDVPIITTAHSQDPTKERPTYVIIAGVESGSLPVRNQVRDGFDVPFITVIDGVKHDPLPVSIKGQH
jgi:hypothetical protein